MIAVTVDDSEMKALIQKATLAEKGTAIFAREVVRAASFAVERRIKSSPPQGMPVDTGRARASWGHGTDSIWRSEEGGLAIVQGSNVEYIEYLNRGHSRQSPAGFIDLAALVGQLGIEAALGLLDPLEADASIAQINAVFLGANIA